MPIHHDLPGLGPRSLAMLAAAGIHGRADVEKWGSVHAYLRVKVAGQNASLNLLWAMEAALTGEDWRHGRAGAPHQPAAGAGDGTTRRPLK